MGIQPYEGHPNMKTPDLAKASNQYAYWLSKRGIPTVAIKQLEASSQSPEPALKTAEKAQNKSSQMTFYSHKGQTPEVLFVWDYPTQTPKLTAKEKQVLIGIMKGLSLSSEKNCAFFAFETCHKMTPALDTAQNIRPLLKQKSLRLILAFGSITHKSAQMTSTPYHQTAHKPEEIISKNHSKLIYLALPHFSELAHFNNYRPSAWKAIQKANYMSLEQS